MTRATFEEMRKQLEDHDPWLEGANLDTRGLTLFRDGPPKEESFIDDRFGGMVAEHRESLRQSDIGAGATCLCSLPPRSTLSAKLEKHPARCVVVGLAHD